MKTASARKNKMRRWSMEEGRWQTACRPTIPFSIFHPPSAPRLFFMASIGAGVIIHALKCQETHKLDFAVILILLGIVITRRSGLR
jgi:hypothetical protein